MNSVLSNIDARIAAILDRALEEREIHAEEATALFETDNGELMAVLATADELRKRSVGDEVSFVINRNINFTNYCVGGCLFCAFHRRYDDKIDGYLLTIDQIVSKAVEAAQSGATEVCLQGGLHPYIEPEYYPKVCEALKKRLPDLHIHAFSPMEVLFVSKKMGCSPRELLRELKASGLDSMPGTAAEILDDSIRDIICPNKLTTEEWIDIVTTAHDLQIPTSATMMYGHVENPHHWSAHIETIRSMQKEGGRFTEFVPLRFVYENTELNRRGLYKNRFSAVDDLKVHAVSRIMLHGCIKNIQVSWVKLGRRLAQVCLHAGANDLGGTLIEENISRLAGSDSPQSMSFPQFVDLIEACKRIPVQRTTTYDVVEVI